MNAAPRSTAASAARVLTAARRRLEPDVIWPLLAFVGGSVGFWIGLDLRGEARAVADGLYFIALGLVAPLPMTALGALYHDPLHARLLPWPVDGAHHLRLGLRLLLAQQAPWLAVAVGAAAGAGYGADTTRVLLLVGFAAGTYLGGLCAAVGFGALAAGLANLDGEAVVKLRRSMAGPFTSERHAPFLYLPAFAFALTAAAGALAELGLLDLLGASAGAGAGTAAAAPALARDAALMGAPLALGLLVLAVGAAAYRRAALYAIPRVLEEARTVYGGRPAPASPPYGQGIGALLGSGEARAHFDKELRELSRVHRGLWPLIALVALVVGAYAANVGDPLGAVPLVGALLVVWVGSLPLRRRPQQMGAPLMLTLPLSSGAMWAGRFVALLFVSAHVGVPVAATLWWRHGAEPALICAGLLVATVALSVSATAPRFAQARAMSWLLPTRLSAAAALSAGALALVLPRPWYAAPLAALLVAAGGFAAWRRSMEAAA